MESEKTYTFEIFLDFRKTTVEVSEWELKYIMGKKWTELVSARDKEIWTKGYMLQMEEDNKKRDAFMKKTDATISKIEVQLADDSLERKFQEF